MLWFVVPYCSLFRYSKGSTLSSFGFISCSDWLVPNSLEVISTHLAVRRQWVVTKRVANATSANIHNPHSRNNNATSQKCAANCRELHGRIVRAVHPIACSSGCARSGCVCVCVTECNAHPQHIVAGHFAINIPTSLLQSLGMSPGVPPGELNDMIKPRGCK